MQNSEEIWRLVDANKDEFEALSDRVWDMPEIAYDEFRSCASTPRCWSAGLSCHEMSPASRPR